MTAQPANTMQVKSGTALDLRDANSTTVRIFGTRATIVHRTDQDEHERRQHHGMRNLDSMELLDVLMDLPVRGPVPLSSIGRSNLDVLRRAPDGVVHFTDSSVTRLVVPAVFPVLAVVHTSQWRDGLERASEFAAYCPRMFVIPNLPDNHEEAFIEASWYGIGVAVGSRSEPTTVLEPEQVPDWQPTVAWWRFCERVYGHMLHA